MRPLWLNGGSCGEERSFAFGVCKQSNRRHQNCFIPPAATHRERILRSGTIFGVLPSFDHLLFTSAH